MGDQWISFEPSFPEHWKMPPGYGVDGICDEEGVFFYWYLDSDGKGCADMFGPDVSCKTKARRGAWDHFRSREK